MDAPARPILSYATPDELGVLRRTLVATRALAIIQLLLGIGAIIWASTIIFSFDGPLFFSLPMLTCGIAHVVVGVLMLLPRPSSWRTARLMLAILLFPALGFIVFGVVLFLLFHEKSGMDQLGAVIGGGIALIATGPYALNLLTLWHLLRPRPRSLFGVRVTDAFIGRKAFMCTMTAMWAACAAAALIACLT